MRWRWRVACLALIAALAGCGDVGSPGVSVASTSMPSSAPTPSSVVDTTVVHVYGDSISVPGSWATEVGWQTYSVAGSSYTLAFGPSITTTIWEALVRHGIPDRAVLSGGVNDLVFGSTPAQLLAAMFEQARALRDRGVEVVLWELLPVGRDHPEIEADIEAVNLILRGQDEFPVIGCSATLLDGQYADATLVPDGRHPSPEGQHRLAECVRHVHL